MSRFSRIASARLAAAVLVGGPCSLAGDVDFVPYYEPNSSWTANAAARAAAEGMFAQFEATLKTGGAWNATIEVWLDDDDSTNYASASAGSFHTVTYQGRSGIAGNPWAQIVQGLANPNGPVDPATGANADLRVHWNFFLSQPQSNVGLLRHELMHGMGMDSDLNALPLMAVDGSITRPGRGSATPASIHDLCVVDAAGEPLLTTAGAGVILADYAVDADWDDANGSGLRILGVKDNAAGILDLPLTSYNASGPRLAANPTYAGGTHTGELDPVHINMVSWASFHPTWNTIAEVDRAWLRGIGYSVKGGPASVLPILSTPAALALQEDGRAAKVWFAVEDGQSAAASLTVQATAAGANPPFAIVTGGAGAVRWASFQPLPDREGAASVTLRVTDPQGNQAQTSFPVSVAAVNDPPVIGPLAEVILPAGSASTSLAFTVQDPDSASTGLSVTATSSDPVLVPPAGLVPGGSGGQRSLLIQPAPGRSGECEITLTVSDGVLSASRSFRFAIVDLTPGDDHAGGFTGASGITAPDMSRDGILTSGDADVFLFQAPGPGLLIAWTSGGSATAGALFSSDGAELQRDATADGTDFRISSRIYAGPHYIEVRGEQAATAGSYTLHLDFIPADRPLALTAFTRSGDDVLLGIPTQAATDYQIEWSDDLIRWTHCKTVPGNKRECYERLPGLASVRRRFFRIYEGPVVHPVLRLARYHYPFDGNGLNALGTAGNFQFTNVPFAEGGIYCNGIYPSGNPAGFSAIASLPKVDFSAYSFSLRFKPETQAAGPVPIFMVGVLYRALEVGHQLGKLRVSLNSGAVVQSFPTSTVNAAAWNTLVCAVDTSARKIRLCLNGNALPDITLAPAFVWATSPAPTTDFTFTNYGSGAAFKGWIDDLRIYPAALTAEDLLAIPTGGP